MVDFVDTIISAGGLIMQLFAIVIVAALFFKQYDNNLIRFFTKHVISLIFFITFSGMIISLYYSDILGYEPCLLCWYQRIFIYSIAFISGYALFKRDKAVLPYVMTLSSVGLLIAVYHLYVQLTSHSFVCGIGESISCTTNYFVKFGYMTIPMLSFTSLAFVLLLTILFKHSNESNN